MTQQNLLEHFVDNLINEAAQQSKLEIEHYLSVQSESTMPHLHGDASLCLSSEYLSKLDLYASGLAGSVISSALGAVVAVEKCQRTNSVDVVRPARHPAGIQRSVTVDRPKQQFSRRRFERQQTVSGFRDSVLSEFNNKLMSSNVVSDCPSVMFEMSGGKKRRSSEPAGLDYSKNSRIHHTVSALPAQSSAAASSVDYREVIASWFTTAAAEADSLSSYVEHLVVDAFVESLSLSSSKLLPRHGRRHRHKRPAVPEAILLYADDLTTCVLQAARHELKTSGVLTGRVEQRVSLQSVAEKFARSVIDDALAVQSSAPHCPLLVLYMDTSSTFDNSVEEKYYEMKEADPLLAPCR